MTPSETNDRVRVLYDFINVMAKSDLVDLTPVVKEIATLLNLPAETVKPRKP